MPALPWTTIRLPDPDRTSTGWDGEQAVRAFVASEPHRSITSREPPRVSQRAFAAFEVAVSEVPLARPDVTSRLP